MRIRKGRCLDQIFVFKMIVRSFRVRVCSIYGFRKGKMYSYLESPLEILTLDDVYKLLNAVDLLYWDHYICKSSGTSK